MTDHPILFSAPMVRAILDGRKTMTRRVLPNGRRPGPMMPDTDDIRYDAESGEFCCERGRWHAKARWRPGDRLWVRETFRVNHGGVIYDAAGGHADKMDDEIVYAADCDQSKFWTWRPPTQMSSFASRITLLVTAVRVERLQDISEDDAMAEGMIWELNAPADHNLPLGKIAKARFEYTWRRLYGPDAWDANPWVSVTTFERIEK